MAPLSQNREHVKTNIMTSKSTQNLIHCGQSLTIRHNLKQTKPN